MKAVYFALVILIFNVAMGAVVNSSMYSGVYYENTVTGHYEDLTGFSNMSKADIEKQSSDVWNYLLNVVSFEWARQYAVSLNLEEELGSFISGMNLVMLFIYSVALIEMFWRRSEVLQ